MLSRNAISSCFSYNWRRPRSAIPSASRRALRSRWRRFVRRDRSESGGAPSISMALTVSPAEGNFEYAFVIAPMHALGLYEAQILAVMICCPLDKPVGQSTQLTLGFVTDEQEIR